MTDQSAKLAAFLSKVGPDADLASMKPEIFALFPGITKESGCADLPSTMNASFSMRQKLQATPFH